MPWHAGGRRRNVPFLHDTNMVRKTSLAAIIQSISLGIARPPNVVLFSYIRGPFVDYPVLLDLFHGSAAIMLQFFLSGRMDTLLIPHWNKIV